MAHWKKFMDKELLGAWDLEGRDVTVVIVDVTGAELNNGTKKNKKPVATIAAPNGRKLEKKLALNSTNCQTITQLAGSPDVEKWKGLSVVLWPTTTQFGGETKECIRIRPYPPKNTTGRNGNGRGGKQHTQAEIEKSLKEQGLIDETGAERRDATIAEAHARVDARSDLSDDEKARMKAEMSGYGDDGDDVPSADDTGGVDA